MTRFDIGDIVRVPFPFVERNYRRTRPALVVAEVTTRDERLYWTMMITSAARKEWEGDIRIPDHEAARLPIPSIIRCAKIATIQSTQAEPLSKVDLATLRQVKAFVARLFSAKF